MKGVRNGDWLSPMLIREALEEIFRRVEIDEGTNINGKKLNNLRFADDIILLAKAEKGLRKIITSLNEEGRKDVMKLNKKKTKFICNEFGKRN